MIYVGTRNTLTYHERSHKFDKGRVLAFQRRADGIYRPAASGASLNHPEFSGLFGQRDSLANTVVGQHWPPNDAVATVTDQLVSEEQWWYYSLRPNGFGGGIAASTAADVLAVPVHSNQYMLGGGPSTGFLETLGSLYIYEGGPSAWSASAAAPTSPTLQLTIPNNCTNANGLCGEQHLPALWYSGFGAISYSKRCTNFNVYSTFLVPSYAVETSSDGGLIAVHTPQDFHSAADLCRLQGRVWIYEKSDRGSTWAALGGSNPVQTLISPRFSYEQHDMFGAAIAIQGTAGQEMLFVGAPFTAPAFPSTVGGAVYAYTKVNGAWTLQYTLRAQSGPVALGAGAVGQIGHGVTFDGRYLVASAMVHAANAATSYAGAVVFELRNGGWLQKTWLVIPESITDTRLFDNPQPGNRSLHLHYPGKPILTGDTAFLSPHYKVGILDAMAGSYQSPPRGLFGYTIPAAAAAQAGSNAVIPPSVTFADGSFSTFLNIAEGRTIDFQVQLPVPPTGTMQVTLTINDPTQRLFIQQMGGGSRRRSRSLLQTVRFRKKLHVFTLFNFAKACSCRALDPFSMPALLD